MRRAPLSIRLVELFIHLFPEPFRLRMGDDLLSAFAESRERILSNDSVVARLRLIRHTIRTILNLMGSAVSERWNRGTPKPERRPVLLSNISGEVRTSLKSLVRDPVFTVVAIFTLALGIGANTAVFTVVNGVLLSPLPYPEPDRLVRLYSYWETNPDARNYLTAPELLELDERVELFEALGVLYTYRETGRDVSGPDGPMRIQVLPVNPDYFSVLGATPSMGRLFGETDGGIENLVVLSHRFWSSFTNADSEIIGGSVTLDGEPYTVVGVMRPGFLDVVGGDVHAWVPQDLSLDNPRNNTGNHYLSSVVRLVPGVSLEAARAEVDLTYQTIVDDLGVEDFGQGIALVPLMDDVVRDSDTTLYILLGAAGLVLLIACVNVANLFVVRGIGRSREIALRAALGAGRMRLLAPQVAEGLAVALVGGGLGVVLSWWGVRALLGLSPESLPRADAVGVDTVVLGFALVATLVTGLIFGAAPAVRAAKVDPNDALREGSRSMTGGKASERVRGSLVVVQLALAVILMTGAGLLMRSLSALHGADLGVNTDNVLTYEVHLPESRYPEGSQRAGLHASLLERIKSIPGVLSASATSKLPASGAYHNWSIGRLDPAAPEDPWTGAQIRVVQGDYFETFDIPLLRGRTFESTDVEDSEWVAMIGEATVEAAFPDVDPIGMRVAVGAGDWTIVGVVDDVAYNHLGDVRPMVYLPHTQYAGNRNWALQYAIRVQSSEVGEASIYQQIRSEMSRLDSELVLYRAEAMSDIMDRQRARQEFSFVLMGIFAFVALALGAIGIYGVLLYSVSERTQEFGVRVALGATTAQVVRMVLARMGRLTAIGLFAGLVAAFVFGRLLDSMLFEISSRDPVVFTGVPVLMGIVALVAAVVPAMRAASVDPLEALRED